MAVNDLQTFLQERAAAFDENIDVSSGSPFDTAVIQPMIRRLGTDPFTVDLAVFISDRLRQAFPELATDEGDALTDLLIKTTTLLWDPIVREIFKVKNGLSFKDPTLLTTDEAEALGANIFSTREKGDFSRGVGRIFFAQPRQVSASPQNFFTSKAGLHYFPDGVQEITTEEMLLNVDGTNYYFDVNLIAEAAGTQYDIDAGELITVANIDAAVRVTNTRRFRSGSDEETAVEFVDRVEQELTERSLVTLRGIGAVLPKAFPEISRLAVVGFNDPEMQRDIIRGGGLGDVIASGSAMDAWVDGKGLSTTSQLRTVEANFLDLIGPAGEVSGSFYITTFGAFNSVPPFARDLKVTRVLTSNVVEVEDSVINPFSTGLNWTLRKKELTLSGIPGGILFPDTAEGTVTVPDDQIHIGGTYDVHLRGASFDTASLVIENLTDDEPVAAGKNLTMVTPGVVSLNDFVLGTDYAFKDELYNAFARAMDFGFTLQILDGSNAGNYRVIELGQIIGAAPVVTLDAAIPVIGGNFRWRLVDVLEVDLLEPKETRVEGDDLKTVQDTDVVETAGATNFFSLGVSVDDVLRILNGPDAGDYVVKDIPAFNKLQVDRDTTQSTSNLQYVVFRSNSAGGILRPLVRITSIELLDTSGQPLGSKIPYAKPIDIQSRAFQNPGRGVKVDVLDARLGIVSLQEPIGGFVIGGETLTISFPGTAIPTVNVLFAAGNRNAAQAVSDINTAAAAQINPNTVLAVVVPDVNPRVGIVPISSVVVVSGATTGQLRLFGNTEVRTSADIRSATFEESFLSVNMWLGVTPAINQDNMDVAQVLDGNQVGFYGNLHMTGTNFLPGSTYTGLLSGDPEDPFYGPAATFAPEIGVHVQVGARSIGSARCFFLEPTSIEFGRDSRFQVTLGDGATVRFFPDPTVDIQLMPALPSTAIPKDGEALSFTSLFNNDPGGFDFVLSGVRIGDELQILYVPIIGTVPLADPIVGLALQTLILSIDGGPNQTVTFTSDLVGQPTNVSRDGAAEQINSAVGRNIADVNGLNEIELEGDVSILLRGSGTANALLGLPTSDKSNHSEHAGTYTIIVVDQHQLIVRESFPAGAASTREGYKILRPGAQRASSTAMNANRAEAGLYFFDVELVSEGTGDLWNISADEQLFAEGYTSDGYFLTTEDPNLAFSGAERPKLHISRTILEVGVSDSPLNATQISGQNIEVSYERSPLVSDGQNFLSSDTERVVNASPLARHLIPHFVRFDFEYVGGSRSDVVLADFNNYINKLFPNELLESSDLQDLAYRRGATSVTNPVDLIAVVHNPDRTVQAQRSQNGLSTGRLSAFVPDLLNINRKST